MILLRQATFWLSLAGIASALLLVGQSRAMLAEPVPPPPLAPPAKPFEAALGASGVLEPLGEAVVVASPAPGIVARVEVAEGDRVAEGELLFVLDSRELAAALGPQEAQIAVADASLRRLRGQLARLEAVPDPRAVTREEVELRRADVAVAEAQLAAARAAVAQTRLLLDRLEVRAPRAGTVLAVGVRAGEHATASGVAPVVLGEIDRLQVRADLDEHLAWRLRDGARAVATVRGDPGHPIPLEFLRVEPLVVPKRSLTGAVTERVDTRVVQVLYALDNDGSRRLHPGQQVDLAIEALP